MTRTLYYFNCQILNESFLYNLLSTIVFLLLNRTLREHSWFVFTMCVVEHLIKVCVDRVLLCGSLSFHDVKPQDITVS